MFQHCTHLLFRTEWKTALHVSLQNVHFWRFRWSWRWRMHYNPGSATHLLQLMFSSKIRAHFFRLLMHLHLELRTLLVRWVRRTQHNDFYPQVHKDKQQELVTLSEGVWMGLFQLVTITWYGRIVERVMTRGRWGAKHIMRTWTEMKWPRKTILDPPISDRLRQTPWPWPWDIVGMLLLLL